MTVSLLVITHNQLGQELIDIASSILGDHLFKVNFIPVSANLKPNDLGRYADQIKNMINQLGIASSSSSDNNNGILILTDICGATPYNLAKYFAIDKNINVVSGINLPMLLRVLNYPDQSLQALSLTAIEGARKGVI
ncbi:MAG: PTS system mannose-specific IIA component [Urechidicola sp.]|jgi:PTS system mannose-specific IIA component